MRFHAFKYIALLVVFLTSLTLHFRDMATSFIQIDKRKQTFIPVTKHVKMHERKRRESIEVSPNSHTM